MFHLLHDLRLSARALWRSKSFTAVTVLTLALGIGVSTAVFSFLNALILRPLPYHDAERLMVLWATEREQGGGTTQVTPADFLLWRQQDGVFASLSAYMFWGFDFSGAGEPEVLDAAAVTPDLFTTLAVEAALGRTFTPEEAVVGHGEVVLLSHRLWQQRFGRDPGVVGRRLSLSGEDHVVVGVMPPGFRFPHEDIEVWVPLAFDTRGRGHRRPSLRVLGRLAEGVDGERAHSMMSVVARRLEQQFPDSNAGRGVRVVSLREQTFGRLRPLVLAAAAAMAAVMLIACANIANLQLARGMARRGELALHKAIGAGRFSLLRQSLSESLLLALIGGVLALPVAIWSLRCAASLGSDEIARLVPPSLDPWTLCVPFVLSLATGLIFGMLPAWKASGTRARQLLADSGAQPSAGLHRRWGSGLLIVLEVGVALFLVIGASASLGSLARLAQVASGFVADDVLAAQISLRRSRYPAASDWRAFYDELLEGLRAVGAVHAVGVTSVLPMGVTYRDFDLPFTIEGRPQGAGETEQQAHLRIVSSEYFGTLGIPLLSGRYFNDRDVEIDKRVAIVNQTMARRFWPAADPLGETIRVGFAGSHPYEIVGVVGDVRYRGPAQEPSPEIYWPYGQNPTPGMAVVVRATGPKAQLAEVLRARTRALDPDLPIRDLATMRELEARSLAGRRFQGVIFATLTSLALLLAAIGIYGTTSQLVSHRTRELAIRSALGARPADLVRSAIGRTILLTLTGMACGALAALAVARRLQELLFEVSPTDPLILTASCAVLGAVAVAGTFVPARRATAVDPNTVLGA